jgi:hypothetical protein
MYRKDGSFLVRISARLGGECEGFQFDAQNAFVLKQGADGAPVTEICWKAGISEATYFNWKRKNDGLLPTEMRRTETV